MTASPDPAGLPSPTQASGLISGNLLGIGAMLTWAAGFPAAEFLMQTWSPLSLITARLALAVVMLLPVWVLLDGPSAVLQARWGRGAVVGGIGFGIGTWLLLVAQFLTDPVTVAIVASAMPITAAVIEMLFDGRRLTLGFTLGLAATVIGGMVAVTGTAGEAANLTGGILAALVSAVLFCWASRGAVKDFPGLSPVGRTTITLAGGLMTTSVLLLIGTAMGWTALPTHAIDTPQILSLLLFALASMALSQLLWLSSIQRLGIAIASFHSNATAFYVMLVMFAIGSAWIWQQAFGALIVAIGVVLAQRR